MLHFFLSVLRPSGIRVRQGQRWERAHRHRSLQLGPSFGTRGEPLMLAHIDSLQMLTHLKISYLLIFSIFILCLKFNFRNSMRRCFGKENVPLAWTEHTLQGTHEIWNALLSHQRRVFGVTPRLHNAKADPSAGAKALITKFTTQSSKLALSLSWKLKTQNMFSYVFRVGQGLCTVKHV